MIGIRSPAPPGRRRSRAGARRMSSDSRQQEHGGPATSPFGGPARHLLSLPTAHVVQLYRDKCGVDVSDELAGAESLELFECERTAYRFWLPEDVAGSSRLYEALSAAWPDYYRTERWEYPLAHRHLSRGERLLEVGCGRGYFLAGAEGDGREGLGLELNRQAIERKVTSFELRPVTVEELAASDEPAFDSAWSFQVLEHVRDPASFIEGCLACLKPGGLLGLSTPNRECVPMARRQDAFDLPPHHVGHFSPEVYEKIAAHHGLELVAVHRQRRAHAAEEVTPATEAHLAYRVARRLSALLTNAAYRWTGEPGPTVLAVLQKPE